MRSEHEVDVVALWWAVWDQKYLVIAIAAVCALIALFVGFTMTPVYRATVVVTPTNDQALSENSSLGGLASFAGPCSRNATSCACIQRIKRRISPMKPP